jgi:homoserine dehydrogenase
MKPLSLDLRERIVNALEHETSSLIVAARFDVSGSVVRKLRLKVERTGSIEPVPIPGRERLIAGADEDHLAELVREHPDATLKVLCELLEAEAGIVVSETTMWRQLKRMDITLKKTLHATERDRPDVVEARQRFFRRMWWWHNRSLVFIDESGVNLKDVLALKQKGNLPSGLTTLDLIEKADFDVAIEATPTNIEHGEPGLTHIKACLEKGAHVVTSNKGPLVVAYEELSKLAERKGVRLMFEATVGGAMPLIKLIKNDLAGNEILSIKGILNGTCNYILSRMEAEKLPYNQILAEAQELKIAEADPTYDVEGIDSAAKLVILANLLGMNARFEDVDITGITSITPEAFEIAMEKDYTIRLIAEVNKLAGTLKVSPRLVPLHHPLAVTGTLNAVLIQTDMSKEIVVMGRGAGKIETASAIISDLVEIYRCR